MVVVILVGILTVMAIPTMAEARFAAHTLDDATKIAEIFREGRTRAMARGAAELVTMQSASNLTWTTGAELGQFTLFEAQVPPLAGIASPWVSTTTPGNPLPGGSPLNACGGPLTNWASITTTNAATSQIDYLTLDGNLENIAQIWTIINDNQAGGSPTSGSLCYTPLGRTYYQRNTLAPSFSPGVNVLHGNIQIAVQRSGLGAGGAATGVTRTVVIPDSGSTRIFSQ